MATGCGATAVVTGAGSCAGGLGGGAGTTKGLGCGNCAHALHAISIASTPGTINNAANRKSRDAAVKRPRGDFDRA
ncbi:MAG TPA: hypothetical protein VMB26_10395 [Candidatus Binataceae bacterium]|nr:hypothetical protein [Candidatus Binataceae bacterium]